MTLLLTENFNFNVLVYGISTFMRLSLGMATFLVEPNCPRFCKLLLFIFQCCETIFKLNLQYFRHFQNKNRP